MDKVEFANRRMHQHRLWGKPFAAPEETLRWFGAMQAQEFVPAKWAIAQRTAATDDSAIEKLYVSGAILRTHVLRPTWHFVHRDDIRWALEATRARVHQLNGTYYRKYGVDSEAFAKCVKAFAKALKGGNELNRRQLSDVLKKDAGVEANGLHMAYVLMRAELDAIIVSGTVGGKAPTYALFDDRVPAREWPSPEEALAELTRRYFISRGPATIKDYVRWSSLTVAAAKQGLSLISSEVEEELTEGRTFIHARSSAGKAPRSPRIDLLQGYDEYGMSYGETRDLLTSTATPPEIDRNFYLHTIVLDGLAIGHWRLVQKPLEVEANLYRPLNKAETASMDDAVNRLSAFFGSEATWVTV